jgi:hypothetical protein
MKPIDQRHGKAPESQKIKCKIGTMKHRYGRSDSSLVLTRQIGDNAGNNTCKYLQAL